MSSQQVLAVVSHSMQMGFPLYCLLLSVTVPLQYICRGWGALITLRFSSTHLLFFFISHDMCAALSVLFILSLFHHLSTIYFSVYASDSLLSPARPDSLHYPAAIVEADGAPLLFKEDFMRFSQSMSCKFRSFSYSAMF